jgi:hypothetical protein
MSLAKLLSAGKSLVGGSRDDSSRYRMGNPGLLPKFGSGNKVLQEESGMRPGALAEGESTKRFESNQDKTSGEPNPKPERATQTQHQSWLRRITAGLSRIRVKPKQKDIPRFAKNPVQAELSLDRVRVVRNDLSDSDLEIVPARKDSSRVAAAGTESKKKTAENDCVVPDNKQLTGACEEARI